MSRILLILTAALVLVSATAGQASEPAETLQGAVELTVVLERFDRGKFQLKVLKHARDPKGDSYLVTYNIVGYASKGVALASEIFEFSEHWRYQNGQEWSSNGAPLGGYLYFFREGNTDSVDIQLLGRWHTDSHQRRPVREEINGVHLITGNNVEKIYDVYKRAGRKELWLESK